MRSFSQHSLLSSLVVVVVVGSFGSAATAATATDTQSLRKRNATIAPIVAVPSEHWEGVDGTWSTFEIRVGTPAQYARVLPATSWQETWVVYGEAAGICNASAGVAAECEDARGGVFETGESTTWQQTGQWALGLDQDLGQSGVGQYGFDTVGLGYTNTTGPTLPHQIVSAIVSPTFWFGLLGLGFQPTNFSSYADPQPSFSDALLAAGLLESRSWSYTAGAAYRLKGVLGQLIFGGLDRSRFVANDVRFFMTQDNLRDVVVTVRRITTVSRAAADTTVLYANATFAFIDSAVPEFWLPVAACAAFERAFGLVYDEDAARYLVNASTRDALLEASPNVTFVLSDQKEGDGDEVELVVPYKAFDLNISSPALVNGSAFYFPLRRALGEGQVTLGRAFLQEVYVSADFTSRTFNVSQCIFADSSAPDIIAIPSTLPSTASPTTTSSTNPSSTTTSTSPSSPPPPLTPGALAGIIISSILVLFLLLLIPFIIIRRRRKRSAQRKDAAAAAAAAKAEEKQGKSAEVEGSEVGQEGAWLGKGGGGVGELDGRPMVEAAGNPIMVPQELEGSVVLSRVEMEAEVGMRH